MKKLFILLCCLVLTIGVTAQDAGSGNSTSDPAEASAAAPDSLSLKERIFYYYDRSEFVQVVQCCNEALEVYQATDDLFEMAGCYNILGIAYQRLGRFKEAIASYQLTAETMEKLKESEVALHKEGAAAFYDKNIRYTNNNMATIYFELEEYDQAEKLYQKCIEMLGEPHDTIDYLDLATYRKNLAEIALMQAAGMEDEEKEQHLKEAVNLAEQALQLSEQYGDLPFNHISKKLMLSQTYHAVGRTQEALALVDEALALAQAIDDAYLLAEIHSVYGEFEANEGHYQAAEHHYREAAAIATDNHFDELQRSALDGAYAAARHFDKGLALDYLEQSMVIKDSIFNAEQQRLLREYQVRYDLSEKEHQIALQEHQNKINRMQVVMLSILVLLLVVMIIVGSYLGLKRKRQNAFLSRLNKTKDHLLSVVSHDFKTSVVSQNMILDTMNQFFEQMTAEQVKEKLLALKTASDSLKEKMFNLFEWIKVELGSSQSEKTDVNLKKLVEECVAANTTELEQKQLEVVTDIPDLQAFDNINMVRLVLQNLLSNAIKFSWPRQKISISAEQEGDCIWVTVKDSGMGISADRQEALLKYAVTPTQGTKNESGTGIGLLLCHQLLIRNGGKITVESKEGQGTTVRFSLMSKP